MMQFDSHKEDAKPSFPCGYKTAGREYGHLPILERRITFGQYAGRFGFEVPYSYYAWLAKEGQSAIIRKWAKQSMGALVRRHGSSIKHSKSEKEMLAILKENAIALKEEKQTKLLIKEQVAIMGKRFLQDQGLISKSKKMTKCHTFNKKIHLKQELTNKNEQSGNSGKAHFSPTLRDLLTGTGFKL